MDADAHDDGMTFRGQAVAFGQQHAYTRGNTGEGAQVEVETLCVCP